MREDALPRNFVMRLVVVAFLIGGLAGCSRGARLSTQPAEAAAQIQGWIAAGSGASDAKRIMEQHGFTCSFVTNGAFGTLRGIDYVYCDRSEGGIAQKRWQVGLVLVAGNVSEVQVTTGLVGP